MPKKEIDISLAHRLLNPGPVVLVTSQAKGRFNIHASPWAMSTSLRPPMVAIAIPPSRMAYDLIRKSGEFVVNIPSADLIKQVRQIGAVSGNEVDKLAATGLHLTEPRIVGVPMLEECIGHIECGLRDALDAHGDHTLFIGEVLVAWASSEAFQETWLLQERELKPLHFLGSDRYAVLDSAFVPGEPKPSDQSA